MERAITYEMFGAVGDGHANDMPAICRAHEEANRLSLPVRAKEGACYYISPADATAHVMTSTDWTGAKFIIDDRQCENIKAPVFRVQSRYEPLLLPLSSLCRGQTYVENPHGCDLFVVVQNSSHADYIRKGLNQDNGTPRTDCFVLRADGSLSSAVAFEFDEITDVYVWLIDAEKITLRGGEFTTIANQAESRYDYHSRNIQVERSNVEISGITHLVTGETDHGAPYRGFLSIENCAFVSVHDCTFTGHFIYTTIGSAGLPVRMGSYDINCGRAASIAFSHCRQTTDIMDERYWGLIGTNFCRDLFFEDCVFSRFDAHMGVTNCTLRRCKLGWQCLNAIGNGLLVIEDTELFGRAFVNLRADYGSTWHGDIHIKNCIWHPLTHMRTVFYAKNDGTHNFGYTCYLPQRVIIDGLTIQEENADDAPLTVFNNYIGADDASAQERPYMPVPPVSVKIRNIHTERRIELCGHPALMPDTIFET